MMACYMEPSNSSSNSCGKMYFSASTGKLIIPEQGMELPGDAVLFDFDPIGKQGFFGGVFSETTETAQLQGRTSEEFVKAARAISNKPKKLPEYYIQHYKIQSLQKLGESSEQVSVPIWIDLWQCTDPHRWNIAPAWFEHIKQAIKEINFAAPGLNLFVTNDKSEAKITINGLPRSKYQCYTKTGLPVPEIYLTPLWKEKKRTSCHELLHALGFHHEHQRRDRDLSLYVHDVKGEWKLQYCSSDDLMGLTRFDPFSILMYGEKKGILWRNQQDPVWFTKPNTVPNTEMSELDKVSLNNMYRPCKGAAYSPSITKGTTGLWYCERYFGLFNRCGPTGPNCPACRVLKSDRVVSLWKKGKWQGWTGQVYCGRKFGVQEPGHNGLCGPNNGPSCPECFVELMYAK